MGVCMHQVLHIKKLVMRSHRGRWRQPSPRLLVARPRPREGRVALHSRPAAHANPSHPINDEGKKTPQGKSPKVSECVRWFLIYDGCTEYGVGVISVSLTQPRQPPAPSIHLIYRPPHTVDVAMYTRCLVPSASHRNTSHSQRHGQNYV